LRDQVPDILPGQLHIQWVWRDREKLNTGAFARNLIVAQQRLRHLVGPDPIGPDQKLFTKVERLRANSARTLVKSKMRTRVIHVGSRQTHHGSWTNNN